MLETRKVDNK